MTRPRAEILADRLAAVLALGQANASQNKAVAGAGGAEIARLAAEARPGAPAGEVGGDRDVAAAQRRLAEANARVAELEAKLAALDAELAAGEH